MNGGDDFIGSLFLIISIIGAGVILWSLPKFLTVVVFGRWRLYFHLQEGHPDCHDGCETCDRLLRRIRKTSFRVPKATAIKAPEIKTSKTEVTNATVYFVQDNNDNGWAD